MAAGYKWLLVKVAAAENPLIRVLPHTSGPCAHPVPARLPALLLGTTCCKPTSKGLSGAAATLRARAGSPPVGARPCASSASMPSDQPCAICWHTRSHAVTPWASVWTSAPFSAPGAWWMCLCMLCWITAPVADAAAHAPGPMAWKCLVTTLSTCVAFVPVPCRCCYNKQARTQPCTLWEPRTHDLPPTYEKPCHAPGACPQGQQQRCVAVSVAALQLGIMIQQGVKDVDVVELHGTRHSQHRGGRFGCKQQAVSVSMWHSAATQRGPA